MKSSELSPAEKLRRRRRTGELARALGDDLRRRLVGLPLEIDHQTDQPVDDEDGSLYVKTDGNQVLRVLALANDLARQIHAAEGIRIVPRVWPRSIWCRKSSRTVPAHLRAPEGSAPEPVMYNARDGRGNTLLCFPGSHVGEHDFSEPEPARDGSMEAASDDD